MTIGLMQPYLFPYLGYFQLIRSVDQFIIYDDVAFIKQGWINRNRILTKNGALMFTVPIANISSYKKINETEINIHLYEKWRTRFMKSIFYNYQNAPYYNQVIPILEDVFNVNPSHISEMATNSIIKVAEYLNISTIIKKSSSLYQNSHLSGSDRVIAICKAEGAKQYVNSIGGKFLYSKESFLAHGIQLSFIKQNPIAYPQWNTPFVESLSIIDVMMFNSQSEIVSLLNEYTLE